MTQEFTLHVSNDGDQITALLVRPDQARWLLVLAHGAGAGMHHPFMETLANELAICDVATFRYQFPYMEQGRKRPDPPALLTATVQAAIAAAAEAAPDLLLLAGGKSLGGRMTSFALSESWRPELQLARRRVRGLVFFGFPLHAPGRPDTKRANHLQRVDLPMLFLQGTRDTLAHPDLIRSVCHTLGSRAALHIIDTADHSFHVLKRSGATDTEVLGRLARATAAWAASLRA
jgi:predicted alpha/beta-hydrolase family hydrolase